MPWRCSRCRLRACGGWQACSGDYSLRRIKGIDWSCLPLAGFPPREKGLELVSETVWHGESEVQRPYATWCTAIVTSGEEREKSVIRKVSFNRKCPQIAEGPAARQGTSDHIECLSRRDQYAIVMVSLKVCSGAINVMWPCRNLPCHRIVTLFGNAPSHSHSLRACLSLPSQMRSHRNRAA